MKPALLIALLVCTMAAIGVARAVDIGLGAPPAPAINPSSLGQSPDAQAVSTLDAASPSSGSESSTDTSSGHQSATGAQIRLPAAPRAKPAISQRATALPANAATAAPGGDDGTSHSHAPSWQSLLPGSIQ